MPETYATDASGRKYRTRKDYGAGINRRAGGRVV